MNCLISMSDIARDQGKYGVSFDHLWEATYLAKGKSGMLEQQSKIHRRLAVLYELYDMHDATFEHLQKSLEISKVIYANKKEKPAQLNVSYLNLAGHQRKLGNYEQALTYLDSCVIDPSVIKNQLWFKPALEVEIVRSLIHLGRHEESMAYLDSAAVFSKEKNQSFLYNVNAVSGELYDAMGQYKKAEHYYKKSIAQIDKQERGYDVKVHVQEHLAKIYLKQKRWIQAYRTIEEAKMIADSLMQIRNEKSSEIFRINNRYQQALQQKDALIDEQNEIIEAKSKMQQRLMVIMILMSLLGVSLFFVIRTRVKLRKTILDKKETELQAQLDNEKNKAVMETKSKELTSYALQLIDKETAVNDLLDELKKQAPATYKAMHSKYKKGANNLWDEFNMRFTDVNSEFY
ncbi:tetratricopeptide repeat protein, partial [Bacteroidales bacterium]|nr:tetratricopeptide repeat protein [Bacteroidales bacterium]